MMNYKGFTLIETIVVIIIISIVMASTLFMGHNYILNLQVQNDKQLFWHEYNTNLSNSFSTSYYRDYSSNDYELYEDLVWDMGSSWATWFSIVYSGMENVLYTGDYEFQHSLLTGFVWSGDSDTKSIDDTKLTTHPVDIWCHLDGKNNWEDIGYSTGHYKFDMHWLRAQRKYRFVIDLESCKLHNEVIYD